MSALQSTVNCYNIDQIPEVFAFLQSVEIYFLLEFELRYSQIERMDLCNSVSIPKLWGQD